MIDISEILAISLDLLTNKLKELELCLQYLGKLLISLCESALLIQTV